MTSFKLKSVNSNPFRNGILKVFDDLSYSLNWHGFKHEIARTTLKSALKNCTEAQAREYLNKLNESCNEILCKTTILN
jgi:hypothetical protein